MKKLCLFLCLIVLNFQSKAISDEFWDNPVLYNVFSYGVPMIYGLMQAAKNLPPKDQSVHPFDKRKLTNALVTPLVATAGTYIGRAVGLLALATAALNSEKEYLVAPAVCIGTVGSILSIPVFRGLVNCGLSIFFIRKLNLKN